MQSGSIPLQPSTTHYGGVDTLRFFCALWVVISHVGQPAWPDAAHTFIPFSRILEGIWNNIFAGPAAVIAFFVISGFCIHLPYKKSFVIPSLGAFYIRRAVRIMLPICAAIFLSSFIVNYQLRFFELSILWSIWCELIYYAFYPFLLHCRARLGSWWPLIGAAYVLATCVVLSDPAVRNYASFDRELNWVLGLPCWLLGCLAAEAVGGKTYDCATIKVWALRGLAIILATICSILRFHSPIGYPWTLNLFALFVAYWLIHEVSFHITRAPAAVLEWLGKSSYSLYLIHMAVLAGITNAGLSSDSWGGSLGTIALMIAGSILFWAAVERPSHRLAIALARKSERLPVLLSKMPFPAFLNQVWLKRAMS